MSADRLANREALRGIPLLQSGHLPRAREIWNPEELEPRTLEPLWYLADNYLKASHFAAIAFTQFPSDFMKEMGTDTHLRRIIFYGDNQDLFLPHRGYLIINPKIKKSLDYFINIEGCGSIENGKLSMLIERSSFVALQAFVWRPGMDKPEITNEVLHGISSAVTDHELVHLEGKDATSDPADLLDFANPRLPVWRGRQEIREEMAFIARQRPEMMIGGRIENWLVYRKGKLVVVDNEGNYQRDFKRK